MSPPFRLPSLSLASTPAYPPRQRQRAGSGVGSISLRLARSPSHASSSMFSSDGDDEDDHEQRAPLVRLDKSLLEEDTPRLSISSLSGQQGQAELYSAHHDAAVASASTSTSTSASATTPVSPAHADAEYEVGLGVDDGSSRKMVSFAPIETFTVFDVDADEEAYERELVSFQRPRGRELLFIAASFGTLLVLAVAAGLTTIFDWIL